MSKKQISPDEMSVIVDKHIQHNYTSQSHAADVLDMQPQNISSVITGRRNASKRLAEECGYNRVSTITIMYEKI